MEDTQRKKNAPVRHLYNGEMLTLGEISRLCGIPAATLGSRIKSCQCTASEAVEMEPFKKHRGIRVDKHPFGGEMLTLGEIAQRTGVNAHTIYTRICRYGISAQEAADPGFDCAKYTSQQRNPLESVQMKAARNIMDILFDKDREQEFRFAVVKPDAQYTFGSEHYDCTVVFPKERRAVLTVIWIPTQLVSLQREYKVSGNGSIQQIDAPTKGGFYATDHIERLLSLCRLS